MGCGKEGLWWKGRKGEIEGMEYMIMKEKMRMGMKVKFILGKGLM